MAKTSGGGGKADPTLVAAGYRLGRSYIPGDYSSIFNKQYEGLIAAYQAKYKTIGDIGKTVAEGYGDVLETITETTKEEQEKLDLANIDELIEQQEELDLNKQIDRAAEDNASAKLSKNAEHYKENGGQGKDHFDLEEKRLLNIKNKLQVYVDKPFLSREEKKKQRELYQEVAQIRKQLVKDKAAVKIVTEQASLGNIDLAGSYRDDPDRAEKLTLISQVTDPNANLGDLEIEIFRKNGKKYYRYSSGRMKAEYNANRSLEEDYAKEMLGGKTDKKDWNVISQEDLFAGISYKETKAQVDINAQITLAGQAASEIVTNPLTGGKAYKHEDFSTLSPIVEPKMKDIVLKAENFNNLATSDIQIGSTTANYKKDLLKNIEIDETIINQMGIGSDILTLADVNNDGSINEDDQKGLNKAELKKHAEAKAIIIDKLTNPRTLSEKEIAATEMAKYLTGYAKQDFEEKQTLIKGAKGGLKTAKTTTGFVPLKANKSSNPLGIKNPSGDDWVKNNSLNTVGNWASNRENMEFGQTNIDWDKDKQTYIVSKSDKPALLPVGQVIPNKASLFATIYGGDFVDKFKLEPFWRSIPDWDGSAYMKKTENEDLEKDLKVKTKKKTFWTHPISSWFE